MNATSQFPFLNEQVEPVHQAAGRPLARRQFLKHAAQGLGTLALTGLLRNNGLAGESSTSAARPALRATGLVFDEICKTHQTGLEAPECPQRYDAVLEALTRNNVLPAFKQIKPRLATEDEIRLCHVESYVDLAEREIESGATRLSTGDTNCCKESLRVAQFAAGAACVAVDAVVKGEVKNAFCLTRPPGHHATADRGMGFCIFNNVGIAARYAQKQHGIGKVLIIDWDVHHGNGTQDIFYEDGSVFFFSTHQSPWYPWTGDTSETGKGAGLGATLNCPMAAGAGRKEFLAAFEGQLLPAVNRFRPELIILSAGFDARHGDPLGKLTLTDEDYIELTGMVMAMAQEHAGGRLVSVLEGGYSLTGLAQAATAHCGRLQKG
jgi:acetoin utilization deacetylase AcuC-like enzyme